MVFWVALAAGLVLGWARGGSLMRLADVRVRLWGLPLGAGALHVALRLWRGPAPGRDLEIAASIAVYAASAAFLCANLRLRAAWPALAGLSANLAATLRGGGRMPVWTAALGRIPPRVRALLLHGRLASHVAMTHPGGLLWLGDVLAVPAPLPADVISAGDLCIALGLLLFVAAAMASEPPASGAMPS